MNVFSTAPEQDERVVAIRSEGPVFCAGLDLREGKRSELRDIHSAVMPPTATKSSAIFVSE